MGQHSLFNVYFKNNQTNLSPLPSSYRLLSPLRYNDPTTKHTLGCDRILYNENDFPTFCRMISLRRKYPSLFPQILFGQVTQATSGYFSANLYSQLIITKGDQVNPLPFSDAMTVLSQCYRGFKILSQVLSQPFLIQPSMVYFCEDQGVRVWMNNRPMSHKAKPVFQYLVYINHAEYIVESIIKIFHRVLDEKTIPPGFNIDDVRTYNQMDQIVEKYREEIKERIESEVNNEEKTSVNGRNDGMEVIKCREEKKINKNRSNIRVIYPTIGKRIALENNIIGPNGKICFQH